MDLDRLECEAVDLYERGDFKAARNTFERLSSTTANDPVQNVYKFNVASCYGSEGDLMTALKIYLEVNSSSSNHDISDVSGLYNIALCLNQLGRYDLTLDVLDRAAQTGESSLAARENMDLAQLLVSSMQGLLQSNLTHGQCKILERLLIKYKQEIIDHLGADGERAWIRNMAHVLFVMDTRFEECSKLYESLLLEEGSSLLETDPIVLGNLCVAYILTGRNRDAEELIKEVEQEDEEALRLSPLHTINAQDSTAKQAPARHSTNHLTHLNLAIATLYCVKNNYEFGLTRMFKSLEPIERKLTGVVWRQAKVCILSALDKHCKQLIYIKDELFDRIVTFLMQCEAHGIRLMAASDDLGVERSFDPGVNSVTYEARYLRSLILTIIHD